MILKLAFFAAMAVSLAQVRAMSADGKDMEEEGGLGINGGEGADIKMYPHQVSLQSKSCLNLGIIKRCTGSHFCGGTILNERTVVTAAHCCMDQTPEKIQIVAGKTYLKFPSSSEQTRSVSMIIIDPRYNAETKDYDVCKMIVEEPFDFSSESVSNLPLCPRRPDDGSTCVITGWGSRFSTGLLPTNQLRKLGVNIVSQETCRNLYQDVPYDITDRMICVGGEEGAGGCRGDSGGPLECQMDGQYCLSGATSWGAVPCGTKNRPTVYADTTNRDIAFFLTS